jgi:hypothetical protein
VLPHKVSGEGFAPLNFGGFLGGAKDGQAVFLKEVDDAVG